MFLIFVYWNPCLKNEGFWQEKKKWSALELDTRKAVAFVTS